MSYRCGVCANFAALFGHTGPREPAIVCNGCLTTHPVHGKRTIVPYQWFLDGKAPPGWTKYGSNNVRIDYCPACRKDAE